MIDTCTPRLAAVFLALIGLLALPVHANILDDDEARIAILELRAKVDKLSLDAGARIDGAADKSAALESVNQNELVVGEVARLRGQLDMLSNDIVTIQKHQKEFYADLDTRIRKLEPRQVTIDGKQTAVAPDEQVRYDAAMVTFKSGDYKAAAVQLGDIVQRKPRSAYAANAQYWLGNAYYAQRNCKKAIVAQQVVSNNYPDSAKAPDALLNMATCYAELKDKKAANRVLKDLISRYAGSPAALAARARLRGRR